MNTDLPSILNGLPIHFQGHDDNTPPGHTLVVTEMLGIPTTYLLRDGQIIGRIETAGASMTAYAGSGLKGGGYLGNAGTFYEMAQRIADRQWAR